MLSDPLRKKHLNHAFLPHVQPLNFRENGEIPPERLIDLDESGCTTQMTRRYARSCDGARIHEAAPEGNWKILTILGAMSTQGMIAAMTIEESTDADIFLAYLDHCLCPKLCPGDVVVMDNLSSHKVNGVRERIEAAGARLVYLPPYSPDLNPIEKAWSKLKLLLRSRGTRISITTRQMLSSSVSGRRAYALLSRVRQI